MLATGVDEVVVVVCVRIDALLSLCRNRSPRPLITPAWANEKHVGSSISLGSEDEDEDSYSSGN